MNHPRLSPSPPRASNPTSCCALCSAFCSSAAEALGRRQQEQRPERWARMPRAPQSFRGSRSAVNQASFTPFRDNSGVISEQQKTAHCRICIELRICHKWFSGQSLVSDSSLNVMFTEVFGGWSLNLKMILRSNFK